MKNEPKIGVNAAKGRRITVKTMERIGGKGRVCELWALMIAALLAIGNCLSVETRMKALINALYNIHRIHWYIETCFPTISPILLLKLINCVDDKPCVCRHSSSESLLTRQCVHLIRCHNYWSFDQWCPKGEIHHLINPLSDFLADVFLCKKAAGLEFQKFCPLFVIYHFYV